MDWRIFVETMSIVEQTLRQDPGDVYAKMDFATRDRYRHEVESIAKQCTCSENEVALQAIRLACETVSFHDGNAPRRSPCRFLSSRQGKNETRATAWGAPICPGNVGCNQPPFPLAPVLRRYPAADSILGLDLGGQGSAFRHAQLDAWFPFSCFPCWPAAIWPFALANWLVTLLVTPRPLPRMDFSQGIPEELRTLVVVPTMLTSEDSLGALIEDLEVRFLANQDQHLHYGLLTDFRDSLEETLPEDEPLLRNGSTRHRRIEHQVP